MSLPVQVVHVLVRAVTGAALLIVGIALLHGVRRPREAAASLAGGRALGLEFLLAAGLLRLSVTSSYISLATAAAVVVVRKVAATGIALARTSSAAHRAVGCTGRRVARTDGVPNHAVGRHTDFFSPDRA